MKIIANLTLAAGATLAALSASAETYTIYSEDFSTYELDTVFTNQSPWWAPNWNGGDIVESFVSTDGPDGARAFTRATQVLAGRFYGGGIRGDLREYSIPAGVSDAREDITLRLWMKATSSQSRGPVGLSVISKDAAGANTGALYYKLPIVPGDWTEIAVSFADMQAGIPNVEEGDFDFSSPRLQVFIWMRTDYEDGWPFQEDEGHTYSVSIADVRIESVVTGDIPNGMWNGFPISEGWVDTGHWMGWLYVANDPWVYSWDLAKFIYMPVEGDGDGAWTFILR